MCPFCPAVPKDVNSRKAFPSGSMQSFMCGSVHKNNRPEHRNICRELTSSHSSLPQTSDAQVASLGAGTPIMPRHPCQVTISPPQPRGTLRAHRCSQGHQALCRPVKHAGMSHSLIVLLCAKTNTSSRDPRERSAVLTRRYRSPASA